MSPAFFDTITPTVISAILRELPNLKRAPGQSGKFNRFTEHPKTLNGAPQQVYIDAVGALGPFPDSLIVQVGNIARTREFSVSKKGRGNEKTYLPTYISLTGAALVTFALCWKMYVRK